MLICMSATGTFLIVAITDMSFSILSIKSVFTVMLCVPPHLHFNSHAEICADSLFFELYITPFCYLIYSQ